MTLNRANLALLRDLLDLDVSDRIAAAEVGVSASTARRYRNLWGIGPAPRNSGVQRSRPVLTRCAPQSERCPQGHPISASDFVIDSIGRSFLDCRLCEAAREHAEACRVRPALAAQETVLAAQTTTPPRRKRCRPEDIYEEIKDIPWQTAPELAEALGVPISTLVHHLKRGPFQRRPRVAAHGFTTYEYALQEATNDQATTPLAEAA